MIKDLRPGGLGAVDTVTFGLDWAMVEELKKKRYYLPVGRSHTHTPSSLYIYKEASFS